MSPIGPCHSACLALPDRPINEYGDSCTRNSPNELTAYPSYSWTYDANGNAVSEAVGSNTTTHTWDFENRLTQVALPGTGGTVTFKYDPFGRRIYKSSSSGTTIFAYDGDNRIEDLNTSGTATARYTQGLGIDEPLEVNEGGANYYYHADGLGSIVALTKRTGSVANSYAYSTFGGRGATTETVSNPFQFTARERDSETSDYYYRARYYDPLFGRFLSEDKIGFSAGVDFYVYVSNDPVDWRDPFGLDQLTDDPEVRRCMCELWKASGWGWTINEVSAWVILNKDKIRSCMRWPYSHEYSKDVWSGPIPSQLDGLVHTHPTHKDRDPKPSTGCQGCDDEAAKKINRPVYTVSDAGVWKITPQGKITKEAGPELLGGFDLKTCECKKGGKK